MDVYQAILKRRTIRQFRQDPIGREILQKLVDAARLAPTGGNKQSWHFMVIDDQQQRQEIFPCLHWAAYLAPHGAPDEKRRPVAYIVILMDEKKAITPDADASAAAMNIILSATDLGIGSCWLGAIDRKALSKTLNVQEPFSIKYVVALGYPGEAPVVEEFKDSVKYYRDAKGVLHVPKKKIEDVCSGV